MNTATVNGCMVSRFTLEEVKAEMKRCVGSEMDSLATFLELVSGVSRQKLS
jgi:hypothetical protein